MNRNLLFFAISSLLMVTSAHAVVVKEHVGAVDPVTAGWSTLGGFTSVSVGPVVNDLGSGIDAWSVDDNGTALGTHGRYTNAIPGDRVAQGELHGFRFSAYLRIVDAPVPVPGMENASPSLNYSNGAVGYALQIAHQPDGDPVVYIPDSFQPSPAGTQHALEGFGGGYHLYEFVKDPTDGQVDFFVDGVEIQSDVSGAPSTLTPQIMFGAGASCCLGEINYATVRFEVSGADEPGCTGAPDGMVGWWPGDDHPRDLTNANDVTLMSGATYDDGKVGRAFSLNLGEWAEAPDSAALSPTSAITIDHWVKPHDVVGSHTIATKYETNISEVSFYTAVVDGKARFFLWQALALPTTNLYRGLETVGTVPVDEWTHITATAEGSPLDMKIYLNGVEQATTVIAGSSTIFSISDSTAPFRIGASRIVAGAELIANWDGEIDEVEIFDRALSSEEIQRIAAAGPSGKCKADHFMAYKTKVTKGAPKQPKFGPVTLADQFRTADYDVIKAAQLLLPADKNGEGRLDQDTHLEEYKVKPVSGTPTFDLIPDVRVTNQCNDLLVEVKKPVSLLVPTTKDLASPAVPPTPGSHSVDHFLCYLAKLQKLDDQGNKLPKFPKGIQVDVEDQFQTRRYDLKKITKLCNPVDKSGSPVILNGPNAGDPKPITPATIIDPENHLVCYQAKLAKKFIAQAGCGAATPGDKGTTIEPKQDKHTKLTGIYLANQFGNEQVDTVKEFELCIPSSKTIE